MNNEAFMRLVVDFSTISQTFSCKLSYHGYKYKVKYYESTRQVQVQMISELLATTIRVHSETFLSVKGQSVSASVVLFCCSKALSLRVFTNR